MILVIPKNMAEKRNIFLVGPMGAGKSTIGRQLA
ncbi:shikimate kinase I, partial [Sodalis-like symbiont of Bactericera trigonica]